MSRWRSATTRCTTSSPIASQLAYSLTIAIAPSPANQPAPAFRLPAGRRYGRPQGEGCLDVAVVPAPSSFAQSFRRGLWSQCCAGCLLRDPRIPM